MFAQSFVIEKEKRLVAAVVNMRNGERSAKCAAVLVEVVERKLLAGAVVEPDVASR